MLPRRVVRQARSVSSAKWAGVSVVHSSPESSEHSVSSQSALQRQQLEFCCLLCGWDVACKTCPFNWFNFDPRKFRRRSRVNADANKFAASEADVHQAMKTLEIDGFAFFTQQEVKDAFRAKALEWHPDCNSDPEAESVFKDILLAYELLLAHAR
ncbi:hypothetical protein V7S43_009082 [Phytophthora oleae]|uniref:J domain-containing protein n=1 Tax=Phytophthora oleae TaxID=2107226 RepID=A0ABD3FGV2_9STRA